MRQQARYLKQTQAYSPGTQLTVEEIKTDNPTYASAKNILKDVCGEFKLYNIAVLNGAEAAPNGEVKTTFNIPDGFGKDIALYAIKADGTSEKVDCEISEDGKTLTAKLSALGNYAICKLGESAAGAENDAVIEKPGNSNTALYIIIAACAVVLFIGGGMARTVIVRKKESDGALNIIFSHIRVEGMRLDICIPSTLI